MDSFIKAEHFCRLTKLQVEKVSLTLPNLILTFCHPFEAVIPVTRVSQYW